MLNEYTSLPSLNLFNFNNNNINNMIYMFNKCTYLISLNLFNFNNNNVNKYKLYV